MLIAGKVCLSASIKVKRQTLPAISVIEAKRQTLPVISVNASLGKSTSFTLVWMPNLKFKSGIDSNPDIQYVWASV